MFRCLALLFLPVSLLVSAEPVSESVTIANGDVSLAGTLLRPPGEGPFPAVVFVHGSGPHTREGALQQGQMFVDAGVAVLAFDKRGAGESTGSWISASLADLAGDIAAAVAWLRHVDGIDPDRIGLWGVSQAGWVAPLAAAQDGSVDFMIIVSGGGASPLQSELFSYQRAFDQAGLTAAQQAEAFALLGDYFWYLSTGRDREQLLARLEVAEGQPWYRYAAVGRIVPSDENRANWEWVANWDPMPWISRIRVPVLLLFGDADDEQPTDLAIERWRQGLRLAGNDDVTIRVFENANHGLRQVGGGTDHRRAPLVEGYRSTVQAWLGSRVTDLEAAAPAR